MNEPANNAGLPANDIGSTAKAIAKGVGIGVAKTVAPRTYGNIMQIYGMKKKFEEADDERKKANDLFGLNN